MMEPPLPTMSLIDDAATWRASAWVTATGTINTRTLRQQFAGHILPAVEA